MPNRVTQKDLAQLAGVSINTVSRALRNDPRISEETRKKIATLAQAHGYRPDPALSALVAYRMQQAPSNERATLALLVNWRRGRWPEFNSAQQTLSGVRSAGAALGYSIEIVSLPDRAAAPQAVLKSLRYRGISGIILAPPELHGPAFDKDTAFWPRLDWSPFSVVALEPVSFEPRVHYIAPNHFSAIGTIWRHLRELGYRRPGLVLTKEADERVRYRWTAAHYAEQLKAEKRNRIPALIVGPHSSRQQVEQLKAWITKQRPDVIISKVYGSLVYPALTELGLEEKIPYISLDLADRSFTGMGVDQNRQQMGATAVTLLHSLMLQGQTGEQPIVSGTLVEGTWRQAAASSC